MVARPPAASRSVRRVGTMDLVFRRIRALTMPVSVLGILQRNKMDAGAVRTRVNNKNAMTLTLHDM
jgi:hypothetical protein